MNKKQVAAHVAQLRDKLLTLVTLTHPDEYRLAKEMNGGPAREGPEEFAHTRDVNVYREFAKYYGNDGVEDFWNSGINGRVDPLAYVAARSDNDAVRDCWLEYVMFHFVKTDCWGLR